MRTRNVQDLPSIAPHNTQAHRGPCDRISFPALALILCGAKVQAPTVVVVNLKGSLKNCLSATMICLRLMTRYLRPIDIIVVLENFYETVSGSNTLACPTSKKAVPLARSNGLVGFRLLLLRSRFVHRELLPLSA